MVASGADTQVVIGHVTDTHVLAADSAVVDVEVFVDNNDRLRRAVLSILDETPSLAAVVATGDLTNGGRAEEYDALADLVDPIVERWLPLPGNHDRPDEVRRRFPLAPWADTEHASWVTVVGAVRIVGLDSTRSIDGVVQHGGEVDAERAAWLDRVLSQPHAGLTVLAMHHPPFASGIWWMDRYGFPGIELLREVLTGRGVERILCGHLHRPMTSTFAGVLAQVGMSTVQHVGLDLVDDEAVTVVADPAGYQLLQVRPHDEHLGGSSGPRAVMHHRYIEPAVTPVVPSWADDFR